MLKVCVFVFVFVFVRLAADDAAGVFRSELRPKKFYFRGFRCFSLFGSVRPSLYHQTAISTVSALFTNSGCFFRFFLRFFIAELLTVGFVSVTSEGNYDDWQTIYG